MAPTDSLNTRDRILDEAERLLHVKGLKGTSVSELVDAAEVQKGTLYHYFSGKQEVALRVIERAGDRFITFIQSSMQGGDPMEQLYAFIEAARQKKEDQSFVGGCLFGNTALEASDTNPELSAAVEQVFDRWAKLLGPVIEEGQKKGQIRADMPADDLAYHVIAVLEGGIMQSRLRKDATIFNSNVECLKRFLAQ
ncbi:MAG: TetR/AcrR family transcriptional regulator [Planctomycetota bacterium]